MNNQFELGTPLNIQWHFKRPDGENYSLSGQLPRLYCINARGRFLVPSVVMNAEGGYLSFTLDQRMQVCSGEYSFLLQLRQNGVRANDIIYRDAVTLMRQGTAMSIQEAANNNVPPTIQLFTVGEFNLYTPTAPVGGADGYWYFNGQRIKNETKEDIASYFSLKFTREGENRGRIIIYKGNADVDVEPVVVDTFDAVKMALDTVDYEMDPDNDGQEQGDHESWAHKVEVKWKEQIDKWKETISSLTLGEFYGFFTSASNLPQGKKDGYAYVGATSPFAIYVFKDGKWSDSGSVYESPVGNGEDIDTNYNNQLQFADRAYKAQNPDGMGYIILRKNKTFVEQIADKPNTIFEIRYDFDLENNEITLPQDCVLLFNGGKLSNGTLIGQNSKINAGLVQIFADINIDGTFNVISSYPEWFGAKGDGVNDDTQAIQLGVNISDKIVLSKGKIYKYSASIRLGNNKYIYGYGAKILKTAYSSLFVNENNTIDVFNTNIGIFGITCITENNNHRGLWIWLNGVENCIIKDCVFENHTPLTGELPQWAVTISGKNITIDNCLIDQMGGGLYSDGIHVQSGSNININNCKIFVEDDCISFTPELDEQEKLFTKHNSVISDVIISNCVLDSTTNCIRFELRNNAPENMVFQNINIHDILINYKTTNGSAILLHDYRANRNIKNTNIKISNIEILGKGVATRQTNGLQIYGRNPTESQSTDENIADVTISDIHINNAIYLNTIRAIGVDRLFMDSITSDEFATSGGLYSISSCNTLEFKNCIILSNSAYTIVQLVNTKIVKIFNSKIGGVERSNQSGIALSLDQEIKQLMIVDSIIDSYAFPFYDGGNLINGLILFLKNISFISCLNTIPSAVINKSAKIYYTSDTEEKIWDGTRWNNKNGQLIGAHAGPTTSRPIGLNNTTDVGYLFYDITLNRDIFWNGIGWVDANGYPPTKGGVYIYGNSSQRPALADIYNGFKYYDTTLNMEIINDNGAWVDANGRTPGKHSGELADLPNFLSGTAGANDDGYPFTFTDDATYGDKTVWWNSNTGNGGAWVDANGTVVITNP